MGDTFRLLVTGSRSWTDYDVIRAEIGQVVTERMSETGEPYPRIVVVHGAAKGADLLAARAALEFRLGQEPHPADWQKYHKRAGYVRNEEMVAPGADLCLAFVLQCVRAACDGRTPHDTHGAAHCLGLARAAGVKVRKFTA
jgi:YspA, cpYpsA-related SLOG family